jgi:hypothetical protein
MLLASGWGPHGNSGVGVRTPWNHVNSTHSTPLSKRPLKGLIVDLNYEVKTVGESFDYKADLKSPKSVEEWGSKLIRDYEKDVQRGKAIAFQ